MRLLFFRRPELLLLASLLVLGATLIARQIAPAAPALSMSSDAQAPLALGAEQTIAMLQSRVRQEPDNAAAQAMLGLAQLQRVRETADVSLYAQAEQAFNAALAIDPKHVDALIGQGSLALSRHQFREALEWGEQAKAGDPWRAAVYGIIGDALTELGRYDEATAAVDKMVATRPDLSSYSRVAYQRELHGDIVGAEEAFKLAISAGGPNTENTTWTQVQLGNLYFNSNRLALAEATYRETLAVDPDYVYARAGMAKVLAARGELSRAISEYEQITQRLPLPEFVIALGELYEMTGEKTKANAQYELVRAMQQLNAAAGMDVDLELALFDADHGGDSALAVERAQAAYQRRPSVVAADALAWSLFHNNNPRAAARYSAEALRLGTQDAAMHYRAGVIAHANGDDNAARMQLRAAININPYFSMISAAKARVLLAQLEAQL